MFKALTSAIIAGALVLGGLAGNASAGVTINTKYVEGTDSAAPMFNPLVVNTFNLTMPQSTIDGLSGATNNWANEGPYLPATLAGTINGVSFGPLNVGVHLKGAWGSWRNIYGKAGFKIKVDAFDKTANVFGITKFTLNNMVQDHSSIHETLSYRLFRAVGVPTARTGYVNITVNGQNYGLHLNLETTDKVLMNRYGIIPSHIYKGGVPTFPDLWPGQENLYAIDQGSTTDVSDLSAVMAVVGRGNGVNWFHDMSALVDLQEMTLDWAAESFVGHWDGYVHNHNNFYLVKRQDGKFIMLPWGMDQTWNGGVDYWSGATLVTQCKNDSQCVALYRQALSKVVTTAKALKLNVQATEVAAAINPTLYADPKKEFGNQEVPGVQQAAINFINQQVANGSVMIAPWDTSLSDFGIAASGVYQAIDTPIVVANAVTRISLSGRPFSSNATAAAPTNAPLAVGQNKLKITVTNNISRGTQSFDVTVIRRALINKTFNVVFPKNSSMLASSGRLAVTNSVATVLNPVTPTVTLTMQQPVGLTKNKALALLKARMAPILNALAKSNIVPQTVTLVIAPVRVANAVQVSLNYEN